jgi:AraC-like DNA-binding protein
MIYDTNPGPQQTVLTLRLEDMKVQIVINLSPSLSATEEAHHRISDTALHSHAFVELFFNVSGSYEIKTSDSVITLGPDTIVLIPPHVKHIRLPSPTTTKWNSVCFLFSKQYARNNHKYQDLFGSLLAHKKPLVFSQNHTICKRLHQLSEEADPTQDPFLPLHIVDILSHLIGNTEQVEEMQSEDTDKTDLRLLQQIEHILMHKYMEEISAETVTNQLFITKRQLERLTKKRFHTTFRQALLQQRLRASVIMLLTTKTPIEQIAELVGFSSRLTFFRSFSKQFGCSPSQYRARHSNNATEVLASL